MILAASKRKAGFEGLNWNQDSNGYVAVLPDMPDLADPSPVNVEQNLIGGWTFSLHLTLKDGNHILLTNHDFGISDGDTPQEMKQAVEDLDQFDIEDVLTEEYLPQMQSLDYFLQKQEDEAYDDDSEEEFASRKGKHMIRRADEKTDTRIVENEDGTFTAYCEGDKKTFDDKGKAAEWLADHFNDEYHDKADARRAARRRMMMRAAARRAAMRCQAMRKAADDDDRKDKGFDVHYDEDGKIHVRFDDGTDMDFDDMHDFADFVEGPDADEKPKDKEEAARARHAARVAMMRRRAARVASRPVARHAMRNDDGHPYL